ncbi:aldehyde dehydrogenase family protein [Senegalia massiliensis]|uniref:aldehyde dehydrogenase family protein n=1 Tax=Senegalia massiliensis TaxID=1720316 RepID=UPI001031291F|nr:aldehyde dehydrogenase family protein [Senegalia massiliensis]
MDYNKLYIDGKWVEPNSTETIEVENPANKEIIAKVPASNKEDVEKAVGAAKRAFETWQYEALDKRIELVRKLKQEMENKKDEMVRIIMDELGRSKAFALNPQVQPYIDVMDDFMDIAKNYEYEVEKDGFKVRKEPLGVIGAITPWNYPLGQIIKKIIPALLVGNTIVLKPSQKTPLVAYTLAECFDKAGFPKGVFNMVTGAGSEVGDMITNHKDIDAVSFTGSVEGGRKVGEAAMNGIKKVTLELGGKSPAVLLKGGDYELGIKKTLNTVYNNTGQTCSAFTRLLVPEDEKEKIEELVVNMSKKYKFGDPYSEEKIVGPVVSKKQFDKVKKYIEKGLDEGANMIYGEVPKDDSKGYYVGPVVFSDVKNDMSIATDEIFGPVLSIITYKDKEDAIKIANDTTFGLAGAVFGPEKEAKEIANKIKAGTITVNEGNASHKAPFGGYKHSGIGREGGIAGFEAFLQEKAVFS